LAEQLTLNQWVQGSSPWWITKKYRPFRRYFLLVQVSPTGTRKILLASPWWIT
jgi:hypothetical protein